MDLRARIATVLPGTAIEGSRDTMSRARPQWRASFSFRGELLGEPGYVHVYVPVDADTLHVNSSAHAPALNSMPPELLDIEVSSANAAYAPGSAGWDAITADLGAGPAEVEGWEAHASPYVGLQHRMIVARVAMPLERLSGRSIDLAVHLGLRLARATRESVIAAWRASGGEAG